MFPGVGPKMTQTTGHVIQAIAVVVSAVICHPALGADRYEDRLKNTLIEYRALPNTQDVKRLVELHLELSALEKEMRKAQKDGASYWRKDYEDIGLYIEHYSGTLAYSGKLLKEAHKRNPDSPYRKYTLFATIPLEQTARDFVSQAESYLNEFPNGPYAENVYAMLGYFYDDLGKTLRQIVEEGEHKGGLEYECFAPYITSEPYENQMRRAFSLAGTNLENAIAANPSSEENKHRAEYVAIIKSGKSNTWHWCTAD